MKKLPFVFLVLILVLFAQTSFAQSNVEGFISNVEGFIQKSNDYRNQQKFEEAIADYEQAAKTKDQLGQIAERKISQAKQKMQENAGQPK